MLKRSKISPTHQSQSNKSDLETWKSPMVRAVDINRASYSPPGVPTRSIGYVVVGDDVGNIKNWSQLWDDGKWVSALQPGNIRLKKSPTSKNCTGPITRFHKTNSKEAIFMWPDMHSFYRFHTFEPIDFLLFSLRKVDHVLRFTDFTVSNCSTFYRFHKFGPILARICEFRKTTSQNDSRD